MMRRTLHEREGSSEDRALALAHNSREPFSALYIAVPLIGVLPCRIATTTPELNGYLSLSCVQARQTCAIHSLWSTAM